MKEQPKKRHLKLKRWIARICWTAFVVFVTSFVWAVKTDPNNQPPSPADTKEIIVYINELRLSKGLMPLKPDEGLNKSAKLKADDMMNRNYWSHTAPDGEEFFVKPKAMHPGLKSYGENLAECYGTNKATVDGWIASPKHYENMVRPEFNLFGTATVLDNDRSCLVTVNHFGQE